MDEHDDESSKTTTTRTSDAATVLASGVQLSQTEQLVWNRFLKTLTKRPAANTPKYPNPDVPEFYPRSMKIVCKMSSSSSSSLSHETGDSSTNESASVDATTLHEDVDDLVVVDKKNQMLLARMSEQCLGVQPTFILQAAPETVRGVTHYYWSYDDPNLLTLLDHHERSSNKGETRMIGVSSSSCDVEVPSEAERHEAVASTSNSVRELRSQLQTKNQQLVHMNNVVKALLEEIYKINELLMRNRVREQESVDAYACTEQYLKMVGELGYPCVDCCARLTEFVSHLSKQLERKIVKQHGQYRSTFVDCILSVIENSLRTLTTTHPRDENEVDVAPSVQGGERPSKRDACTQTIGGDDPRHPSLTRCVDSRRSNQQVTRVYRNRNYYKYEDVPENAPPPPPPPPSTTNSRWTRATRSRNNGMWRSNVAATQRRRPSTHTKIVRSTPSDAERSKNPIQLVHQRFKNVNCRLEGIPEKKLVKFSYLVDNKEYSAIATTKKEAQYLCAWHMLNSCCE